MVFLFFQMAIMCICINTHTFLILLFIHIFPHLHDIKKKNFAYFEQNGRMRIFSGGGVQTPEPAREVTAPGSTRTDGKPYTFIGGGHSSQGNSREIGFPLGQELLQVDILILILIIYFSSYFFFSHLAYYINN